MRARLTSCEMGSTHFFLLPICLVTASGAVFEDHAQTVWLGLDLALLAYRNGRFFEIMQPSGIPLWQNKPLAITEDTDGNIWAVGRGNHLYRIKGQKVVEDIQLARASLGLLSWSPTEAGVSGLPPRKGRPLPRRTT